MAKERLPARLSGQARRCGGIDDIGDMPRSLQSKILRLLQSQEFRSTVWSVENGSENTVENNDLSIAYFTAVIGSLPVLAGLASDLLSNGFV
jgi:hypothetical protein